MKKLFVLFFISAAVLSAQSQSSKISSLPGAFSRLGFGARGIGMGNAMSAVTEGSLVAYYNPALSPFQIRNSFQASYSFLSLDRSLNFLSFTRRFEFGKKTDENGIIKPRSVAGLSIGIINSGVSSIGEYDNQGFKTGDLSTSENLIFLGLSNRFSEKVSIGVAIKLYYYKLFEDISSTGLGFDIGAVYLPVENLSVSFVISDINSKYKWDSTVLYDQDGSNTEDKFPVLKKLGVAYKFTEQKLLVAIELESSNAETNFLRFGLEYNIFEQLYFRGGIDKWNLSNSDFPVQPSIGFSYSYALNNLHIGIDYAFAIEPFSAYDKHIIGVNISF